MSAYLEEFVSGDLLKICWWGKRLTTLTGPTGPTEVLGLTVTVLPELRGDVSCVWETRMEGSCAYPAELATPLPVMVLPLTDGI